jgi:hypothetical protein
LTRSNVEVERRGAQEQLAEVQRQRHNAYGRNRGQPSSGSGARGSGHSSSTNVLVSDPSAVLPPNSNMRNEPAYHKIMGLLVRWESNKPQNDELMTSGIYDMENDFAKRISERIVDKAQDIIRRISGMLELNRILDIIIHKNIHPANNASLDFLEHKHAYNITTVIHDLRNIKDIYPNMDEEIRQSLDELIADLVESESIYVEFVGMGIRDFCAVASALASQQRNAMARYQILKHLN